MKPRLLLILIGALLPASLVASYKITRQAHGPIEMVVDWQETAEFLAKRPGDWTRHDFDASFDALLLKLKEIGICSVVLEDDAVDRGLKSGGLNAPRQIGYRPDLTPINRLKKAGLLWYLRMDENLMNVGVQNWINPFPKERLSNLFLEPKISAIRLKSFLSENSQAQYFGSRPLVVAVSEEELLSSGRMIQTLIGTKCTVVRAHYLGQKEMADMDARTMKSRWLRAVKERSCRFLFLHWNLNWNVPQNLAFGFELYRCLKGSGYILAPLEPSPAPNPGAQWPGLSLRLLIAWFIVAVAPVWALWTLRKSWLGSTQGGPALALHFLWGSSISVIAGIYAQALLPEAAFQNGGMVFRGVKPALTFALSASAFLIADRGQILERLKRPAYWQEIAVVAALGLAVMVLFERSGNDSSLVFQREIQIRNLMENILGARPRFKEFLIGHPLLILGLYLHAGKTPRKNLADFCLWAGGVGLISILNSFVHLHTPLTVTLLRTFHGVWIGAFLGLSSITLAHLINLRERK